MRVAIMSREYPPDTGWGGIATYKYHLAHGLKALGHDVEIFSLSSGDEPKTSFEDGILVHRTPVHNHSHSERLVRECSNEALSDIHKCMPHVRYILNASLSMWRKFDAIHETKRFDVIDAPELFADSLFVSTRRNVPLAIRLLTPHAKFIADELHNISRTLDHEMVAVFERIAMLSCDVITSPSHDLAQWVADDLNYPVEKMMIVRDPMDCQAFRPDGPRAFEAPDKVKVLFVGRYEERKGVHYIVDAVPDVVARNPAVHFYFLGADTKTGPGGTSVLDELKRRLAATGSLSHVTFIAPVPHANVPEYMRSADICVVPSLYDNSPFTCVEAMASGKPVIGSSAGGTPEYVIDGKVGTIVPARDARALGDAISELVSNKAKREQYGLAAREWCLSQYAREIVAAEALEVYRVAQQNFAKNNGHSLNLYDRELFVRNADQLTNSLDLAFHDLRLQWSLRYRLQTAMRRASVSTSEFLQLARQRPKLAAARLALGLLKPFAKSSKGTSNSGAVTWLESGIKSKQVSSELQSVGSRES